VVNKLFIDMNKFIMATFNVGSDPPDGLNIRIMPIYAVAGFSSVPVRRCPNHASPDDANNQGKFADKRDHIIRVDNDFAVYEEDDETKRLSVIVPVEKPQVHAKPAKRPRSLLN
jgi:hypothetical protein